MIAPEQTSLAAGTARLWTGGAGDPLVLVHGGWGGARMHWATVWDTLAGTFRVLAPEIPGIAYESARPPRSLREAAAWINQTLDATEAPRAWITGNSLGALIALQATAQRPDRYQGLILVNGGPRASTPALIRRLMGRTPMRQLFSAALRRSAWRPTALQKAFADPQRVPDELRRTLNTPEPWRFRTVSQILTAADVAPTPPPLLPALVIWGSDDRMPGTSLNAGRRVARSIDNAQLALIPDAGHLPQIEQPDRFTHAVRTFVTSTA